jgi:hypothetical protein
MKNIEKLLFDYLMDVPEPDEWDEITAVETPRALKDARIKHRSGEYLKDELAHAVVDGTIRRCS